MGSYKVGTLMYGFYKALLGAEGLHKGYRRLIGGQHKAQGLGLGLRICRLSAENELQD